MATTSRKPTKHGPLTILIALIWGSMLIYVGLVTTYQFADEILTGVQLHRSAAQTTGMIVVHERSDRSSTVIYQFAVQESDQLTHTLRRQQLMGWDMYYQLHLGDRVTINYVPDNPQRSSLAQIDPLPSLWGGIQNSLIVLGILGLGVLLIWFALDALRQRARP